MGSPRGFLKVFPRAVLFDHDGTLVESESLHSAAWRLLLQELGLPYHERDMEALVGMTAPGILASFLDRYRPGWSREDYDLEKLALRKNHFYGQALKEGRLRVYPGVREGIEWLRAKGVRVGVVSNARRRELVSGLQSVGLAELMHSIVARDDAGRAKPDPTPYLMGAAELGVEPGDALAVEDSPTGLESALLAGIPAAAVETNFSRRQLETPVSGRPGLHPVWVGPSIAEFFAALKLYADGHGP